MAFKRIFHGVQIFLMAFRVTHRLEKLSKKGMLPSHLSRKAIVELALLMARSVGAQKAYERGETGLKARDEICENLCRISREDLKMSPEELVLVLRYGGLNL